MRTIKIIPGFCITALLLLFNGSDNFVCGQNRTSFTDVTYYYILDYAHGLEINDILYKKCVYTKEGYACNAVMQRANGDSRNETAWFDKALIGTQKLPFIRESDPSLYQTVIKKYSLSGEDHLVYKTTIMNCYDPFCGTRHNHIRSVSGYTWYTPQYGILLMWGTSIDYEVLGRIGNRKAPAALIAILLKEAGAAKGVIDTYLKVMKE